MEGFMYKFHPQIERTLELVRAGALGFLRSVHATFTFRFTGGAADYRWSPARGGGALYDVGCYAISAARLLLGEEPVAVTAAARLDPTPGVDVTAALLLEFPGGRFALCDASFESHFQSRLLAVGADAVLRLDRAFSAKDSDTAVEIVRGDAVERRPVPRADMFALMIDHFDEAALGRVALRVPPSDAWSNMRTIDAAFESLRTGVRVVIL
jgi:predicted dehydrogenase